MGLFSIRKIVRVHYSTIIDESNTKRKVFFVFLGVPVIIAFLAMLFSVGATTNLMMAVVSMLAILIGFSINAVFLLMSGGSENPTPDEKELFENTRNITLYSIIVGLFSLVLAGLVLTGISNNVLLAGDKLLILLSGILFFLLVHYVITLFLLPARLYVIVELSVGSGD